MKGPLQIVRLVLKVLGDIEQICSLHFQKGADRRVGTADMAISHD